MSESTNGVTVILVCWRRMQHFRNIVQNWYEEPSVSEVMIWDNSGNFSIDLPVTVFNSSENVNPAVRYAIAAMAKNDIIIHCDDDVLPKRGITEELLKHYDENALIGVEGVNFVGESYFDQSRIYGSQITTPTQVDMVIGFLTITNKKNLLGHDYSKFSKYQLEMNLQALSPKLKRIVAPVSLFEELDCSKDQYALHLDHKGAVDKERIYKEYFKKRCIL